MSKKPRIESPTGIYHITHRGNNKEQIFAQDYLKLNMCRFIKESLEEFNVEIYAYCIMSNHLHLLVKGEIKEVSDFVHMFALKYANYYNWKYKHIGHVFQGRFRSQCIDSESYFWACIRYIHLNPVKAGIIADMKEYSYSSANEYYRNRQKLLHAKALQLKMKKFPEIDDFWKMHARIHECIFDDLEEDTFAYFEEIVRSYVAEIQRKYELEAPRIVYEVPKFRNELKRKMRDNLKISRNKTDVILNRVISRK